MLMYSPQRHDSSPKSSSKLENPRAEAKLIPDGPTIANPPVKNSRISPGSAPKCFGDSSSASETFHKAHVLLRKSLVIVKVELALKVVPIDARRRVLRLNQL